MGLHLNWLAVRSADKAALLDRLGFREIGAASDEMRGRYACAVLPTGWTVIVSADYALDLDDLLPVASAEGGALGSEVSEVVMYSRLRSFEGGRLAWAVTHDPEQDVEGLEVEGEPPPQLEEIRARQAALKAAEPDEPVDYMFDAPKRLAKSLCGYTADEPLALEWTLLGAAREGPGAAARPAMALRDAIRGDFLPLLRTRGWEIGAGRTDWPGGAYDVWRLRGGWFQALWFTWKDDGRDIYFLPDFGVWRGQYSYSTPFVAGMVRPVRPPFLSRLAGRFRELARTPQPDERLAQVVARARDEILAADRFLTEGVADPGLHLSHGSVATWRDALQDPDAAAR